MNEQIKNTLEAKQKQSKKQHVYRVQAATGDDPSIGDVRGVCFNFQNGKCARHNCKHQHRILSPEDKVKLDKFLVSVRATRECHECHEKGHTKWQCPKLKKQEQNKAKVQRASVPESGESVMEMISSMSKKQREEMMERLLEQNEDDE